MKCCQLFFGVENVAHHMPDGGFLWFLRFYCCEGILWRSWWISSIIGWMGFDGIHKYQPLGLCNQQIGAEHSRRWVVIRGGSFTFTEWLTFCGCILRMACAQDCSILGHHHSPGKAIRVLVELYMGLHNCTLLPNLPDFCLRL